MKNSPGSPLLWADLHLHSPHSIATSKAMTPRATAQAALRKGLGLISTGDALHPGWLDFLEGELAENSDGFFRLADGSSPVNFVAGGEVNCVWRSGGKSRRVHLLYLLPDLGAARRLSRRVEGFGKLSSDGRPTLKLPAADFIDAALGASPAAILIAAHIWTPWFGLLGGKSGFDSIEQALGPMAAHLTAVETGLSSDPAMNRRVSALDRYSLVSFSDAHGPLALGREATALDGVENYPDLLQALKSGEGIAKTVEFYPAEGKYYLDGHRKCAKSFSPADTPPGLACPACARPLTPGVLGRIERLADRTEEEAGELALPHIHLLPLAQVASQALGVGPKSKKVVAVVDKAVDNAGSELAALMDADPETLGDERLSRAVTALRSGNIEIEHGYDGQFGKVQLKL